MPHVSNLVINHSAYLMEKSSNCTVWYHRVHHTEHGPERAKERGLSEEIGKQIKASLSTLVKFGENTATLKRSREGGGGTWKLYSLKFSTLFSILPTAALRFSNIS